MPFQANVSADLASCFESSTVCAIDGASISNASKLESTIPDGVLVGVVKQDATEGLSNTALADTLYENTDASTVIIIEDKPGNDGFGVATQGDAAAITESLYGQAESDGGIAVQNIAETLTSTSVAEPPSAGDGFVMPFAVGGVALAVVVASVAAVALFHRMKNRKSAIPAEVENKIKSSLDGEDGKVLSENLDQLKSFVRRNHNAEITKLTIDMVTHISQLFVRMKSKSDKQTRLMTQLTYRDYTDKLLLALNDDYYGDIIKHPGLWTDPDKRKRDVHELVSQIDKQAIRNIQQVNQSQNLEFEIALGTLNSHLSQDETTYGA